MAKKGVSISSIGTAIRRKQGELKSAKRGSTPAQQKKIDLKIKALDKHHKAIKAMCAGWKAI